jgi:hypothetical protein
MSRSERLALVAIILAAVACVLAGASWWRARQNASDARGNAVSRDDGAVRQPPEQRGEGWLQGTADDKFNQVEKQLRGFDMTMAEVGYRFTELYFAGKEHNWDYAKYQAEKIDIAVRLGLERRPKRAQSAQFFLADEIPEILKAIEGKDDEVFHKGMDRLRSSCMKCHNLEKVPYFTVEFPERRLSPVRNSP